MSTELQKYEDMVIITIKPTDEDKEMIYRFIQWKFIRELQDQINSQKTFMIGEEIFLSRNFQKAEKHNGIIPTKEMLEIVQQKIRKYRSIFFSDPSERQLQVIIMNAKAEAVGL